MNVQVLVLEHGLPVNGKDFNRWTQVRDSSHAMMQLIYEYREENNVSRDATEAGALIDDRRRQCPYPWFFWATVSEAYSSKM